MLKLRISKFLYIVQRSGWHHATHALCIFLTRLALSNSSSVHVSYVSCGEALLVNMEGSSEMRMYSPFEISNRKQGVTERRGRKGKIEAWRSDTSPRGGSKPRLLLVSQGFRFRYSRVSASNRGISEFYSISFFHFPRSKIRSRPVANLNDLCRHRKYVLYFILLMPCKLLSSCLVWIWKLT